MMRGLLRNWKKKRKSKSKILSVKVIWKDSLQE